MKTNSTLLKEAERALHDLLLGQSARVFVDQNGERVEYSPANRAALERYVSQLKQAVARDRCHHVGTLPNHLQFTASKGLC